MDMEMNQSTVRPVQRTQLPRFTGEGRWVLCDMTVDSSRVAVCGHNEDTGTTSIDLFRFNYPDSSSPLITPFYSKEFKDHPRWTHRSVAVLGDSGIVTVCGNLLNVYNIKTDDMHSGLLPNEKATCMTVGEGEILIGLYESNKVIAFDFRLNQIKTITLRKLERNEWLVGITVCRDNLFISTSQRNAKKYNMEGVLLQEYKIPGSSACSITVSSDFGLVFVSCDLPLPAVVVYSLSEGHTLFTSRVIDGDDLHRIRINNVNRFMFTTSKQGILRVYSTASILTFSHLKEELSSKLTQTDCGNLGRYFSLPPDRVQTIITSPLYSKNFLLALEERGYIHPSNVNQLTDALTELKINHTHLLTETYMKLRDQETEYDRFLAGLSAHLTFSITVKLCDNFEVTDENKNTVISSQNPGLSFLLTIDEMGIINPSDVSKLEAPLEEYRLLQAVAKVHEYQSLVLYDEIKPQDEDKESLFLKCLQQKMKSWFETMTPVPWMKSCQWKSNDLFIASRLVLTNSGSKISSREVDRKCKLHYLDIFTDERLKAETRIILEGQPGSGKTMLSSQLAYDWCCGKLMDIPIVIYLPLKIVDNMTIIQAIKMFYIREGIPITEEDIESMLNSGKKIVYLILDGLEEYNGGTKDGSPSEVMRVMTKEKLSNCIVLITARTDYAKHPPQGPMLKIGSFGQDERDEYIGKVYSDDQKRQEEVKELIDNVPFILDLCNVPLLFVLLVHNIDRLGKLQEGQLDRVTPFVKAIVDILCPMQDEEDKHSHLSDQKTYITLEELAFNGLCKGNQQLFWQKDFVDRSVTNSKAWIDSGILVVEDGTPFHSPSKDLQTDSGSGSLQTDSISDESLNACSVTSEIKRGVSLEPDHMASVNQSKNKPILEPKEKKSKSLQKGKAAKHISLQVKFLHKLIQEWFAAKYLALLFFGHKSTEHHDKYQLFGEHLAIIDPADLHYILRFTCHICPSSFHFIASFLMRDFKTEDGEIPDYIINCICLCFAEYDGYKGHKVKDIFTEICRRESVNFSSEDSRLLLMSKVSMLTSASRSQIPIKCLKLSDVVEEITEKALILKADVSLGVLNTLRAIEVNRWDQKLIEQDYEDLIKFIINNEKVEVVRLLLPSPPVAVNNEKDLKHLQSRDISVEWIIGANLIHTLNVTTGEWMMEFRLPGRMSAKSSSLKPISEETNKTVEQQEYKSNDVPSKGKDPSLPSHQAISGEAEGNLAGAEATTIDREEVTNETLQDLSGNLFKEWRDVGRNLKLAETELDNIEADNRRKGQKEVVYHMLLLWKRKHGMKATNTTLRDALIAANGKDLSDYLLNREQCGTTSDSYVKTALSVQAVVDKEGRILEIPGTGVRLDIPPGAIDGKCLIEMKIISNYIQEESTSSFASNSTVVVELLPDNVKLHHRAKLTLPHCLKLKNPVECKAMVFSSHHDQGTQRKWRPKQNALYQLNETNCIIWVESFSWKTCQIDGRDIEFKIQVYAACSQLPVDSRADCLHMELGYYIDLPGKKEIIEKNDMKILQEKPLPFSKDGRLPLKILLEKIQPESWKCIENTNPKELSFRKIVLPLEDSCSFSFDKVREEDCTFYFKATLEETIELRVPYKGVSTESLSDHSVPSKSGNVPHSEKRCIDESTAEVIDVPMMSKINSSGTVHEEQGSLIGTEATNTTVEQQEDKSNDVPSIGYDISASSLSGIPVPSKSGDVPHPKKRPFNESTAVLMDVSVAASSPSDSSVPSKSGNVPHTEKRCMDKSTAVVKDIPMMGISTEPLADCSVPSKSGNVPHSEKRCIDESKAEAIDAPLMSKMNSLGTVHEEQGSMIETDNLPSNPLQVELWVNKVGGVLELPDTSVSLEIPPGALEKDEFIQMRIIPYNLQGYSDLSFSSNSSVVVELLPSNLKLLKRVKLTLPHCLALKEGCEWKAKIYCSHHEEGTQPLWELQLDTPYELNERNCIIKLRTFGWKKFDIGDEIVEGKCIILYAAKHQSSYESQTLIDTGFFLEGCDEYISMNKVSVLQKKPMLLLKKGQSPLKFQFVKTEPPVWNFCPDDENPKEIPFISAATLKGSYRTFVFNKKGTMEMDKCSCYFIAGQGSHLTDLTFVLEVGGQDSAASSSDKVVDAGISQSQKKTGDGSLTDNKPIENIDLEVSKRSLEDLSKEIPKEWKNVGRKLGLADSYLDKIEIEYTNKALEETVYRMLLTWKQRNTSQATYRVLGEALKAADRTDMQEVLYKQATIQNDN